MSQYRPDVPPDARKFTDVLIAGGVNQQELPKVISTSYGDYYA
jgi:hypothetical protein